MAESETILKNDEYRCAHCGTVYQFTSFDAKAELEANFPGCPVEQCEIICDDCFNGMPVKSWGDHWSGSTREKQEKLKALAEIKARAANSVEDIIREREIYREALVVIKDMKPSRIVEGIVHGPQLLLDNCQRIARCALKGKRHV